jgi:hypothetical protein
VETLPPLAPINELCDNDLNNASLEAPHQKH